MVSGGRNLGKGRYVRRMGQYTIGHYRTPCSRDGSQQVNLPDDIDPTPARSLEDFACDLRRLKVRAGLSFRQLEKRGKPLSRSTVSDVLHGKRLPSKELLHAFIKACSVDPDADKRWEATRIRLTSSPFQTSQTSPPFSLGAEPNGLLQVGAGYFNDLSWGNLFSGTRELDIFVVYGQTWRNIHHRDLDRLARRKECRIRVFLADPEDEGTVAIMADRFAISPPDLRARIWAAGRDYEALRREGGANIEIYYRPGDHVFSFYRFDKTAVISLYSHTRTRTSVPPTLVCESGNLYQFVLDELEAILKQSRKSDI